METENLLDRNQLLPIPRNEDNTAFPAPSPWPAMNPLSDSACTCCYMMEEMNMVGNITMSILDYIRHI